MINYLVRVELHHDEHAADYITLHDELHKLRFFRVSLVEGLSGWHDLPTAEYLNLLSNLSNLQTLQLVENVIVGIIKKHAKYVDDDLKNYYSIIVTQVATTEYGQLMMQVHLQPTTDATKLPPGETL
jgi:hypothetical protein